LNNIKEFVESSKIRKAILFSIANRLNYSEIDKLHEIFIQLDEDNDGCINFQEFQNAFNLLEKEKNELDSENNNSINDFGTKKESLYQKYFMAIDTDRSKKINYSEFIAAAMDKKFYEDQTRLLEIFENFDSNRDGKLSISEFEKVLNISPDYKASHDDSYQSFRKEFEKYDLNHDGEIDYNEFVQIVTKKKDDYLPKKPSNSS